MRFTPLQMKPTGRAMRLMLVAGLALSALATLSPVMVGALGAPSAPAAAAPRADEPLPGTWRTFANGDTVNQLLRDGDYVWSATAGGGLVRWDLVAGSYRQWLAPQDGLVSNDVNGLDKAVDGRLWLATGRGLSVLDPATGAITSYTPANSPGMPARVVLAVKATPDGRLWVGFGQEWDALTEDPVSKKPGTFSPGGLARFDPANGVWDEELHAKIKRSGGIGDDGTGIEYETILSENVTDIEIGSDGILWVGTRPYYVWDSITCPPEDPTCTADGAWVLAGGGLAAREGSVWGNWLPASNEQSCYSTQINDLAADVDGRMWVATGGRGLMLMKNGLRRVSCKNGSQPYYIRPIRDTPGPRGNYIWSVDVAPDGRVWVGQGQGHHDGLGLGILDHNNTFDDSSAANQGAAWRFDDVWDFINLDDGPATSNGIISVLDVQEPTAVLMAVIDNRLGDGWGLRVLDTEADTWLPLRTADAGLPSNQVTDVAWNGAAGELWVATRHQGVARFDGQGWAGWQAFGRGQAVASITLDVAANKDRIPVDMADQAAFDAAFPTTPRYVRFGDDATLYRLTRANLTTVGENKYLDVTPKLLQGVKKGMPVFNVLRGPASNAASQVCFGQDGTVWAGGRETIWLGSACPPEWGSECWLDGGLGQFDGSQWRVYDQQTKDTNGKTVPDQEVQSCAVDGQGRVWVGTGDARSAEGEGIAYLDPATGNWTAWKKAQGSPFAGNGVSDIDVDPVTGDVWAGHHATQDCVPPPFGGACQLVRVGGGVSRWNGSKWDMWQKPTVPLKAFGSQGEVNTVLVDRGAGRVWAGAWDAREKNFHWGDGFGVNAAINWCPLDCTNSAWQSQVWPNEGEVAALALDGDGRLWAGVHRSGNGITPPTAGHQALRWRHVAHLHARELRAAVQRDHDPGPGRRSHVGGHPHPRRRPLRRRAAAHAHRPAHVHAAGGDAHAGQHPDDAHAHPAGWHHGHAGRHRHAGHHGHAGVAYPHGHGRRHQAAAPAAAVVSALRRPEASLSRLSHRHAAAHQHGSAVRDTAGQRHLHRHTAANGHGCRRLPPPQPGRRISPPPRRPRRRPPCRRPRPRPRSRSHPPSCRLRPRRREPRPIGRSSPSRRCPTPPCTR